MTTERAVIVAADLLVRMRLEETARAAGLEPESYRRLPPPPGDPPAVLALDLDLAGVLDSLPAWRERWPSLRVVGFVSHVDGDTRDAALALGCEVFPRGATARKDPRLLVGGKRTGSAP